VGLRPLPPPPNLVNHPLPLWFLGHLSVENLSHAVSLHFMYYNFARIHKTLRVTPAMEAGVSDHVWELGEIVALTD